MVLIIIYFSECLLLLKINLCDMFNFDDNVRATIVLLNRLRQKYRKIIIFAIYHSISFYRQFSPRPTSTIIARVAHTLLFPLLPQSLPTNSTTAAFSPF